MLSEKQKQLQQLIAEGFVTSSEFAQSISSKELVSDKQSYWVNRLVDKGGESMSLVKPEKYYALLDPFASPRQTPWTTPAEPKQGLTTIPGHFTTLAEARKERRECNIGGDLIIYEVIGEKAKLMD